MSKIVKFRMGKGRTFRPTEEEEWTRKYLELEVELSENLTEEGFHEALLRSEYLIDNWIGQPEVPQVPKLDPAELDALPWKKRDHSPAKPGDFGWLFGPSSFQGVEAGAEKLVQAIKASKDGKLVIGNMEYSLVKDDAFIQRRPVKGAS